MLLQRIKPGATGKNDWEADFGLRLNLLAQLELSGGGMAACPPAGREWERWHLKGGLLKDLIQTKAIFSERLPLQVLGDSMAKRTVSLP